MLLTFLATYDIALYWSTIHLHLFAKLSNYTSTIRTTTMWPSWQEILTLLKNLRHHWCFLSQKTTPCSVLIWERASRDSCLKMLEYLCLDAFIVDEAKEVRGRGVVRVGWYVHMYMLEGLRLLMNQPDDELGHQICNFFKYWVIVLMGFVSLYLLQMEMFW